MSEYPRTSDTTCAARTVDAGVRGAVIGAMWGGVSYYTTHRSETPSYKRPLLSRNVLRNAINIAAFSSIYSAVHCMVIKSSHSETAAAAVAGAAVGCFAGAKAGASGRIMVGTCLFGSAVSVAVNANISAFEMRNE